MSGTAPTLRRVGDYSPAIFANDNRVAAVRDGVERAVEAEYLVALWLLVCVAAAIDRRTIARGRVGLVRDGAIGVDLNTLKLLGFRRGRKADGYDGDYYVLEA